MTPRFKRGLGALLLAAGILMPAQRVRKKPCSNKLPEPWIKLTSRGDAQSGGQARARYQLTVTNWNEFPDELFRPAPELPPCGTNKEASRTWVDIYDEGGGRLYGYCALSSPNELGKLVFSVTGRSRPALVYLTLTDRQCQLTTKSNLVRVSK